MTGRAATWFLTALIALGAANSIPPSRCRQVSEVREISWQMESAERRSLISAAVATHPPSGEPYQPSAYNPLFRTQQFIAYLYQRPPPSFPL